MQIRTNLLVTYAEKGELFCIWSWGVSETEAKLKLFEVNSNLKNLEN